MSDELEIEDIIPPIDPKSELENKYLLKKEVRKDQIDSVAHSITIYLLRAVIVALGLTGAVRVWPLLTPNCWHWLSDEQVFKIDEFFVHGTIGVLLIEFLRGRIGKKG